MSERRGLGAGAHGEIRVCREILNAYRSGPLDPPSRPPGPLSHLLFPTGEKGDRRRDSQPWNSCLPWNLNCLHHSPPQIPRLSGNEKQRFRRKRPGSLIPVKAVREGPLPAPPPPPGTAPTPRRRPPPPGAARASPWPCACCRP